MPVPMKSSACELSQLLITVEALRSKPLLQVGKQVVVTQSVIRTVRRVVKQLPVETVQQCSSESSYMQTCIIVEEHYTGCQHSIPFILNGSMQFFSILQYASDILVAHHMHLTISTPFLSSKKVTIGFLLGRHLLNLFSLFGKYVHIHCFDFSSVSTFTNETQVSSPITCTI
jgi:hypothetical protein